MTLSTEQLLQNYDKVCQRIEKAASQSNFAAPNLLAVSKTKPANLVEALYHHGHRDFGENYLQDACEKIEALSHLPDICWHFIGQIQSNKTKTIAEHFDWVHSVDRLKIAKRLNDQRPEGKPPMNVCLQVNLDNESQKGGIHIDEALELAQQIHDLPNLALRGLMAIPKPTECDTTQKQGFASLREQFNTLITHGMALDTLSMGMSSDLENAIVSGSTMVRIGTDIFGARA